METFTDIVPRRHKQIEIYPFDDANFIIHQTDVDYRIKVGNEIKNILELVDGERRVSEITRKYSEKHRIQLTEEKIYNVLFNDLARYGIIESTRKLERVDHARYLGMRVTLFSAAQVKKVSHLFVYLFDPLRFYLVIAALLSFVVSVIVTHFSLANFARSISSDLLVGFMILSTTTLFLHELGHATACRKFGAKHGDIGFGFYMFTPVLYTDVSDVWKLRPYQRIIVDLGGFYMEAIVTSILTGIFLYTHDPVFLHLGCFFLVSMFLTLNPLFRRDGYWALCDAFNITNLKPKSNSMLYATFKWIMGKGGYPFTKRFHYFLLLYGFLDWSFIAYILISILLYNPGSVLYFPYNVFMFFHTIFTSSSTVSFEFIRDELFGFVLPLTFYVMVYNRFLRKKLYELVRFKRNVQS